MTAPQPLTLNIRGMHCNGCAQAIRTQLLKLQGVQTADVFPDRGQAIITGHPLPDDDQLGKAIAAAGDYRFVNTTTNESSASFIAAANAAAVASPAKDDASPESLYPLCLIVGYIAGVTLLIALATDHWSAEAMMRQFMAGFFIVFSFFKLLDPAGFVSAYRGYDFIAGRLPVWGWAYPYVELGLGIAYLLAWAPVLTNAVTLVLMLIGAAGVLKALLDRRAIRCACLGTALNLPMTKVTLVEDLSMAAMAAGMLMMHLQ